MKHINFQKQLSINLILIATLIISIVGLNQTTIAYASNDSPVEFNLESNSLKQSVLNYNTETKSIRLSVSKRQESVLKKTDSITFELPEITVDNSVNLVGGTGKETISQDGKLATLHFTENLDLSQSTDNLDWYISFRVTAQNKNQNYPININLNQSGERFTISNLELLTNTTTILPSGTWILGAGYQNENLIFPDGIINSLLTQDASDDITKNATFSNEGPYVSASAIYNIDGNNKSDNGAVYFKLENNLDLSKIYMWSRTDGVNPTQVTRDATNRVVFTSSDHKEGYIQLTNTELQERALQIGIIGKINNSLPTNNENPVYQINLNAMYNLNPIYQNDKIIRDKILNPNNGKFKPYIQFNYPNNMKLDVNSNFDFSQLVTAHDVYDGDITKKLTLTVSKDGHPIENFNQKQPGDYILTYSYKNSQGVSSFKTFNVKVNEYNPEVNPHIELRNLTLIAGPKTTWKISDNIIKTDVDYYYQIDGDDNIATIDTLNPGIHSIFFADYDRTTFQPTTPWGTVNVNIIKTKAAVITQNSQISLGSNWQASDNIKQILDAYGNEIPFESDKLSGTVDTSKPGNYTLTYRLEDIAGNIIESKFTVTVSDTKLMQVEFSIGSNHNYIVKAVNSQNKTYPANSTLFLPGLNKEYTIGENGTFELANSDLPDQPISGLAYISSPSRSNNVQVTIPARYTKPTEPIIPENNDNNQAHIQDGLVHYFTDYGVLLWQQTNTGLIPTSQFKPANSYVPYYGDFQIVDNIKYLHLAGYNGSYWIQAQYLLDPSTLPEIKLTNTKLVSGNVPYGIFLRDASGNMTSQVIEPGTVWQVHAKKQFYGHTYYRIGNNNQWIEDSYSLLY